MHSTATLRGLVTVVPVVAVVMTAAVIQAATYTVDQGGNGDFISIQTAIESSTHGDVIEVHPGTYFESLYYGGRRITVRSTEGPEVTILDGADRYTLARFLLNEPRSAVLEGFTLQNGRGTPLTEPRPSGPEADLTRHPLLGADPRLAALQEGALQGGTAGGAILLANGNPTLRNLIFRENLANNGGAIYAYASVPLLDHCHFMNNIAGKGGAIAGIFSAIQIEHNEFHGNTSVFGGAVYLEDSPIEVHMSIFEGHLAAEGGAWYALGSGGPEATAHHTVFQHNGAEIGHAIVSYHHPVLFRNDVFYENQYKGYPSGAIHLDGDYGGGSIFQNIFFGENPGLTCNDAPVEVYCNDFFPGPLPDCARATDNITKNPFFCDPDAGDFSVRGDSPCLPGRVPSGCGFIGIHLEAGCPSPAIDLQSQMEQYHERIRATRPD